MTSSIIFTFASVALTSSVALVCLVTLGWDEAKLKQRIPLTIAITIGVLFGEAMFHLMPEALRKGIPFITTVGLSVLGFGISYGFEILFKFYLKDSKLAPVARIALIAESIHNAIDGALIAAAYLAGPRIGLIATVAILLHELPHELGNFSVLVHSGYDRQKALVLNCLSASVAFVGALIVIVAGKELGSYSNYVLPVSAGCFIYISVVDLLPGMLRDAEPSKKPNLWSGVIGGAVLMLLIAFAG